MKLATRISLYFLAALAIVLAGFSGSIYWLVQSHLYRQLDDRSEAALDTLNAAIESGPAGLEWEVNDRHLVIGQASMNEPIAWGVFDETGQRLDGSKELVPLLASGSRSIDELQVKEDENWKGETWRIARLEVRAVATDDQNATNGSRQADEPATKKYSTLVIAVGTSVGHVTNQLRTLGMALAGLSVLIWLSAAVLGRWLCQKALAPLTRMADSIATISAADLSQRLSTTASGDELEELSRAFNDLLVRLQTSFERQRRFAAEASHQLRTPLTGMLGQVDVALRRDRTSDEYCRTLNSVHEQATHLHQIVEMLLFLTREDTEAAPPHFDLLELNDWLTEHLASWQHSRRHDIHIDTDRDRSLWINVHSGLLGQAVDNLLDNACKYSEKGSTITVRTRRIAKDVWLAIEDCGYGIPEDDLARVRDPFFRSVDARQRGVRGIGLGLSIVVRIVSTLNAKLSIESFVGRGSTFNIIFRSAADVEPRNSDSTALSSSEAMEDHVVNTI